MPRRELSDLHEAFGRKFKADDRDLDGALWEVYMVGVRDGMGRRRARSSRTRSPTVGLADWKQENVKRAASFIRRIAQWKRMKPEMLVSGKDMFSAHQRQEAYLILRELPGRPFSFPVIAEAFGKKDHAAVLTGVAKVKERIANDPGLGARLRQLARRIGAAA